ncbi:MAG TPA: hypothetical protein VF518_14160, partial [Polyangia bacterium]
STSNPSVATVSATGASAVVTTVAGGTATITVTTQDGGKTAICLVTVAMSAQWIRVPTGGVSYSTFASVAVDDGGNVYAAGLINGQSVYNFGNSISVAGGSAATNLVLVKYDPSGAAKWARSVTPGPGASAFTSVATDAAGNIFAVGTISGTGSFGFGNSVVAAGAYGFGTNLVLVKYDATGAAKWARTVLSGISPSAYSSVSTDSAGNIYAAGTISGGSYDFGSGIGASGTTASGQTAMLVKYNPNGIAQWAQGTLTGSGETAFNAVTANATDYVYAAGYITGSSTYGFGNAVSLTGKSGQDAMLVQYNTNGMARWARTSTGNSNSTFNALAATATGTVFAAGSLSGHTANGFGIGINVTGSYADGANALLLKYDPNGTALWGVTPVSATGLSHFSGVALDAAGSLYVVGALAGPGPYDFGNSMVASTLSSENQILLAHFDPAGQCHSVETANASTSASAFASVVTDSAAHVYACGAVNGTSPIDFGNTAIVTPASSMGNGVLVRYQ